MYAVELSLIAVGLIAKFFFRAFFPRQHAASNSWQAYAICLLDVWMSEGTPEILDINDVGELAERGEWVLAKYTLRLFMVHQWPVRGLGTQVRPAPSLQRTPSGVHASLALLKH